MISNNRQKINNERSQLGFSTLEILLAMTLLIFAFSGAVSALSGNQSLGVDSQTNGEALRMGQMELDNAQARARSSFFAINSTPESVDDIYTKKLKVEWIDDYVKKIKSRVSWESGTRRGQSLELETLVTSPENALRGDTCDPDPSGDWQHP
ncbi:MAG: type II secretion system protein, partial [Candidatus Nealsonbacteria bacterium]|nr:type II secretion system protein [Candidatus Nealsonbacteria bacterium]